jgi:two-component system, cell cycle response regulator
MIDQFPAFDIAEDTVEKSLDLTKSHELLKGILESSCDGIAVLRAARDDQNCIVAFNWILANSVAANIVGKTPEQLPGTRVPVTFPGLPRLLKNYIQVVESSQPFKHEFNAHINSRSIWLDILAIKFEDGLAVTFRDISEVKELSLKLKEQGNIDGLTGVMNRRSLEQTLDREWRHCIRAKKHLTFILCDLDHFKRYNDRYGPQSGDDCLKQIARELAKTAQRPRDFVARFGGEKFAIILAETPAAGAETVARSIQEKVSELRIAHSATDLGDFVTVSMGVATTIPTAGRSLATFIKTADKALQQAKDNGRNGIVFMN